MPNQLALSSKSNTTTNKVTTMHNLDRTTFTKLVQKLQLKGTPIEATNMAAMKYVNEHDYLFAQAIYYRSGTVTYQASTAAIDQYNSILTDDELAILSHYHY